MAMNKVILGMIALALLVGAVATTAAFAADQTRTRDVARDGTCDGGQQRLRLQDKDRLQLDSTGQACNATGLHGMFGFGPADIGQPCYQCAAQLNGTGLQYRAQFRHGSP